jgi:excisionase family DNA binding protein
MSLAFISRGWPTPPLRGDSSHDLLEQAKTLPVADLPHFVGQLETARLIALGRLTTVPAPVAPDRLLSIVEACERLKVGKDYLYKNSKTLPFTRRVGRALRFSSAGIDAWIARQRG